MYDRLLIATAIDSLSMTEPEPSVTDAERALQLYEQQTGYGQWKVIFPGTVVLSEKVAALLGFDVGTLQVPLENMINAYLAEDRGKLLAMIAQSLQDRRGFRCRLRTERPDGQVRMIETIADLRVREGRVTELFGASRDVTQDMEREQQLQARSRQAQEAISDLPTPIVTVDEKLRVLDCSVIWLKAHRFMERRQVVGRTLAELFPDMPADNRTEYEAALKGQTVKTRRSFVSPSTDQPVSFNTIIAPWFTADRKVGGFTLSVGWSETAIAKTQPRVEEAPVEDTDGSLLDMLKTVI